MTNFNTPGMGINGSSWQAHGYSGNGNVAELIDSERGRAAIICGGAVTVFSEFMEARSLLPANVAIFAVNEVGMFLPHVDHWASLHGKNLQTWKPVRWLHPKTPEQTLCHSIDSLENLHYNWSGLSPLMALSGYFAMQIAWIMGFCPIVLCGCPGTPTRRFFDLQPRQDFGYGGYKYAADENVRDQVIQEMQRIPEFKECVASMGGWTRSYFGGIPWLRSQLLQQQKREQSKK